MPRNSDGISLHVSGFRDNTRPSELASLFESHGRIADVYIPKDYYTGLPRGFAYIQYEDDEIARQVYESGERFSLDGRTLRLEYAQGKRKSPNQMRGGGLRGDRDRSYQRGRSRSRSPDRRYRHSSRRYSRSRSRSLSRNRGDRGDRGDRRRESHSPMRRRTRSVSRSRSPYRRRSPSPRRRGSYRSPTPPRHRSYSPKDDGPHRPGPEETEGHPPLRVNRLSSREA